MRVAEAALSARDGVPPVLADAFVPPVLAGQAKAVVEDWRSGARVLEHGVPRVHEQIATWGVPLRWFVFVDLGERELAVAAGAAGAALPHRDLQGPPARPPGAVGAAQVGRRRADHRGGRGGRPLAGGVPSAVGGGAGLRRPGATCCRTTTLAEDDSPGLVAAGLAALSRGDADAATEAYEKLVARWRAVQLLERCN